MRSLPFGHGQQNFRLGSWAPRARPVIPPRPLYVDVVAGSAGAVGDVDHPVNSLTLAMGMCAGLPDWEIRIKAPATAPIRLEAVYESSMNLTLAGWDGEPWHQYGSEVFNGGWAIVGGGVWRRPLNWTAVSMAVVVTMDETVGDRAFHPKLLANTVTPSVPGQGQIGLTGGYLYVRLFSDENPNNHVIEVARRNGGLRTQGFGLLKVRDYVGRHFLLSALQNGLSTQPAGTGRLEIEDSLIEYSAAQGVAASGQNETTVCTRVIAHRCANDGFNLHGTMGAQTMTLNGCEGSYSGDAPGQSSQGASNHESTTMILNGGRYDWNVSGGMVAIDSARCDIHGDTPFGPVVMDRNMRLGNTAGTISNQAGCAWLNNSSGAVSGDVTVSNGLGVGVRVATPGAVSGVGGIKSVGNALPNIGV
nr:hypothetical protein [uncultured Brevundimonas sp.]